MKEAWRQCVIKKTLWGNKGIVEGYGLMIWVPEKLAKVGGLLHLYGTGHSPAFNKGWLIVSVGVAAEFAYLKKYSRSYFFWRELNIGKKRRIH